MFPDTGRRVRGSKQRLSQRELARLVGEALKAELGPGRRAAKTLMDWTGVCDRAARNWLSGEGGVSGANLILLARHSDAVWELVTGIANRPESAAGYDLHTVEVALSRALGSLERLRRKVIRGDAAGMTRQR